MKKYFKRLAAVMLLLSLMTAFLPADVAQKSGAVLSVNAAQTAVKPKAVNKKSGIYSVKIKQNKVNYRKATVTFKNVKGLKKAGVTKIKIRASMYDGSTVVKKKTNTVKMSSLSNKKNTAGFTFPAFGKWKVKVTYYSGSSALKTVTLNKVGIVAEEYNIAALNGTFGPLLFTLSLWDIKEKDGHPVPTIVTLLRAEAYNWKKLPKNVYANPLYNNKKNGKYDKKVKKMAAYVKDLHQMNPNSKFNVYLADNGIKSVMDLMYGNGIKDSQFKLTLLSDGTGTYAWFNKMYNSGDSAAKLKSMQKEWVKLRNKYLKGKTPAANKLKYALKKNNFLSLSKYTYAAVSSQSNYEWWVARKNNFEANNEAFLETAKEYSEQKATKDMLDELMAKGSSVEKEFKSLYRFSSDFFSTAKEKKKEVMLFMGTRVNLEQNFNEFASFVKKYYGDKYLYYYKGHPGTATKLYPEKQSQLKKLGITDVESSVAAELILYFNPDVKVSNVADSSTNEAYTKGMPKAFNGVRLADKGVAGVATKGDLFECFFTKITKDYEKSIKDLCGSSLANKYLVEFNGISDIAIYDSKKNSITKYSKQSNGTYKKK